MRHCPRCASANPDEFRFCRECGATLLRDHCPGCGAPHDPDQAFCGRCGTALTGTTARPGPPEVIRSVELEERKLATVLFADVVGFTSLAERTDPETVARMVDTVFRQMATVIGEHGGTVDKYMGDCLMAVFGVPLSHEDDAARAVAAALAISRLGGDLVFSIGINSGEVMATAMGGSEDVTVIGDAVNVAARLEKAAGPGQILCGALTAELAGSRAVFSPRQPIILKGKKDPVDVWEAAALASIDPATDRARGLPLIGRQHELAYLGALLDRVRCDGRAQMAVVCGEAGSGKTRLLDELARSAGCDATIIRASHPAYGATGGQRLAADLLEQLGPIHKDGVKARVWSLTGRVDESLKDIDATSIPDEQLWGVAQLLEEKSATQPLLLLLDDMHWSGDSVLGLIGNLEGRVLHLPILLVVAGRAKPADWLQRFPGATTIRLGPLGRRESAGLAAALMGDHPLTDDASDFFVNRSGGNPLYMRELVRMAKDTSSLVEDRGRYRLSSTVTVPASLQAVLAARLDALPAAQKEVFEHVALLGDGATAAAIGAIGDHSPDALLGELVVANLLHTNSDGTFQAAEPLLREVAYETLSFRARTRLHRRAASIVVRKDERASHLERAAFFSPDDRDLAGEAATALAEAGMELAGQSRIPEARRTLERAVELGARDPTVLLTLCRLQEGSAELDAAAEVLALIGDDPADPSVAIERDHIAARLKMFTQPERAGPLLEAVSARWQEAGDEIRQAWAIANAGVASFNMGRMDRAADALNRAFDIFERNGDRAGAAAASSFLCLARPTDPRVPAWLTGALEFAEQSGDRGKQLAALTPLAWHHFIRSVWGGEDETVAAERFALRLAEMGEELGVRTPGLYGRCLLLLAARYSGRLERAAEQGRALESLLAPQAESWLPAAALFARSVAGGGADAPVPFNPPHSADPVALIATQVVGVELLLRGRVDEALSYLTANQQVATNLQTEMSGVMTGLALVVSGRPDEARPWVERAQRAARLLGAAPVERAAIAVRAEIEGDAESLPVPGSESLSIGEALVLRAHAAMGDEACLDRLLRVVGPLAAPGLLTGIPGTSSDRPHSEAGPT